uniref:Adenylate cyclase n=1 Tax=Ganoderma boninense TaxID=34458 RepID=A0A5K1JUZ8_9APHY|nr:Adenylate cyclase [Ganoderma boninense]
MAPDSPLLGTRLKYSDSIGTIRYAGPVDGAQGTWLGVEWDEPNRGKHDGVKDGKRYFTCLAPNGGSFIRPTAAITYGLSFLTALTSKYIEVPFGDNSSEKVILGSSGGAIEVQAVGLNKIRNKLARIERLREVSLDDENVSRADPPGEIHKTCPGIRGLDLSKNLIPSWDIVADIAIEMPNLRRLRLNQNRMRPPQFLRHDSAAFHRLEELQLSATLTTWNEFQILLHYMPALTTVELGYNRLQTLRPDSETPSNYGAPALQEVNLDGNELDSFLDINKAMNNLPGELTGCIYSLQRLILTSNQFSHIHPHAPDARDASTGPSGHASPSPLRGLKHLALAFNRLASWRNIDTLQGWCPELESLTLAGNPLIDVSRLLPGALRMMVNPTTVLQISSRERTDSELLYLSHIAKQPFPSDDERRAEHPQWDVLSANLVLTCSPSLLPPNKSHISAPAPAPPRLPAIAVHYGSTVPPATLAAPELAAFLGQCKSTATLRVLSTMSIRTLRLKLIKTLKIPKPQHVAVRLWMILPSGHLVELTEEFFGRDLAYWGIDADTQFVV